MFIRSMQSHDESSVRALSKTIYDDLLKRPDGFHRDHPTLVTIYEGAVVAYATYQTVDDAIMILNECAVDPAYRGMGLARELLQARLAIAATRGLAVYGAVRDSNAPMIHLLESFHFTPIDRIGDDTIYRLLEN